MIQHTPSQKIIRPLTIYFCLPSGKNRKGLDFGGKRQKTCRGNPVIKRLNTEAISGQKKSLLLPVIQSKSPHAVKMVKAFFTPSVIGSQDDFGIRMGVKTIAIQLKLRPQLGVVINLSIIDNPVAVGITHRLMTKQRKIDDGKPPMSQNQKTI